MPRSTRRRASPSRETTPIAFSATEPGGGRARPYIGRAVRRSEDRPLLTGSAHYVDDLKLPDVAHLVLVRSPHAHARIDKIDLDRARHLPDIIAVVTAADLAAIGPMPVNRLFPDMIVPEHPILATGVARAQGTPIVAVVAQSLYAAADAAAAIVVHYAPIDGVADADAALGPAAPRLFAEAPGNRSFAHRWRAGDADRAFATASRVIRLTVRQQRLAGVPLEPRGALAAWNAARGELTVWTSTQAPFRVRAELARMLGFAEARVRVIAPEVGGGFGVKGGPYREEVLIAWLARYLGRPVKWMSTRAEDLVSTHHSRGGVADAELALTVDGTIGGLRAQIACPLGSSVAYTGATNPRNYGRCLPGPYAIANVDIGATGALTTTPPVGSYRGAGRPEAAFLMERLVDEAARALAMDPVEIRRRNLVRRDAFPYATATGQSYDSGDFAHVLEQAVAVADYPALRRTQAARRAEGEIVGVGVAVYVEPSGIGWESGVVRIERTGAVTAVTGSSPHGQGHETTFAQIVADHLGVAPEVIAVKHGDTHGAPQGTGTFGSRSVALGGSALALAARDVQEKGRRIAAHLLEAAPADVQSVDGGFQVIGTPDRFVPWRVVADVVYRGQGLPPGETPGLESTRFFQPEAEVWSAGAVVVAIRIDRDTGEVMAERLVWVDDAGTIVNPLLADGQLQGSLAQAWGQAVMEAIQFDASGHLLTGTLMDYAVPHAADVPAAEILHAHTPSPRNPLGAKGLGEAGTIGIPPAVVNAVVDALSPFGVTHLDMPLTAEKIWRVISAGPERRAGEPC